METNLIVSTQELETALDHLRSSRELADSSLLKLHLIRQRQLASRNSNLSSDLAVKSYLSELVERNLTEARARPAQRASIRKADASPVEQLTEDFRRNNRQLEAWSALCFRYCQSDLDLRIEDIAKIIDASTKHVRERINLGLRLLRDAVSLEEASANQHLASQQNRLLANLPGISNIALIGRKSTMENIQRMISEPRHNGAIALVGMGGIGKTALAHAVVSSIIPLDIFANIVCFTAKREVLRGTHVQEYADDPVTPDRIVNEIITQLGFGEAAALRAAAKISFLRRKLREEPYLIVIDNLETAQDYQIIAGQVADLLYPSKALITSRHKLGEYEYVKGIDVLPLDETETLELVRQEALERDLDTILQTEDEYLREIYVETGGNPLAIRLIMGQLPYRTLGEVLALFKKRTTPFLDEFYTFLYWGSWQVLSEYARQILSIMPRFPVGGMESAITSGTGLSSSDFQSGIAELVKMSLVARVSQPNDAGYRYSIHPLTRHFVLSEIVKDW